VNTTDTRVIMTYDGSMSTDTDEIHPLPVPEVFRRGSGGQRTITVAAAFDPPVRRQRREYLAASMKVDVYRDIDPDELVEILKKQDRTTPGGVVGPKQLELGQQPGLDDVVVRRPGGAHGHDHIETGRVGKVAVHRRRVMVLLGDDEMHHDLEAALGQPFADEPGHAQMIMLENECAHPAKCSSRPRPPPSLSVVRKLPTNCTKPPRRQLQVVRSSRRFGAAGTAQRESGALRSRR